MFKQAAREWLDEMEREGRLTDMDEDARGRLVDQYAGKLEEIYQEEVLKQMEFRGKKRDYEHLLAYDSQYTSKYLNQVIPGYPQFRTEVFARAKKLILGG
jgi:membrane protein involved in colicin uptake